MHALRQNPCLDTLGLPPLSSCPLRRLALAIRAYWRGAIEVPIDCSPLLELTAKAMRTANAVQIDSWMNIFVGIIAIL